MNIKAFGNRPVTPRPAAWNLVAEEAIGRNNRERLGRPTPPVRDHFDRNVVKVKNVTGNNLPLGSVLDVGGYLLNASEPDRRHFWFEGDEPDGGIYGVLQRPCKDEEIQPLQLIGVCIARVDVTAEGHMWARPVPGQTYFESADNGPVEILSKPSGTGVKECVVVLRTSPQAYIAQTGGSGVPARSGSTAGSASVTLYDMNASGALTSLGISVTAYNLASSAVAANTYIHVKRVYPSGLLVVDFEDCG